MQAEATSLHPTLWRTCRAIANRTRLQIIRSLLENPNQNVSVLAGRLNLTLPVASQYLRVLEARSLLTAQRNGRWVKYKINTVNASALSAAIIAVFRKESDSIETVFKVATAFTHPRRIELFKLLSNQPRTVEQLRAVTKISSWALSRHLHKLESRGFIARQEKMFVAINQASELRRELARLAVQ